MFICLAPEVSVSGYRFKINDLRDTTRNHGYAVPRLWITGNQNVNGLVTAKYLIILCILSR